MNLRSAFDRTLSSDPQTEGLSAFDAVAPADPFEPLSPGQYRARVLRGEIIQTKGGVDGYRMQFEILQGECAGRKLSRTWVFTAKALPYAKRDLSVFGLKSSTDLLAPFPKPGTEVFCRLWVAQRMSDDLVVWNDIKRIDQIEVQDSAISEFVVSMEDKLDGK